MKKVPFLMKKCSDNFSKAIKKSIAKLIHKNIEPYSAKENRYRYHHGDGWIITNTDKDKEVTPFNEIGSDTSLSYESVRWLDLTALKDFIHRPAKEISGAIIGSFYEHINKICDENGNTINANHTNNFKENFLLLLQKIKFSVDRNGFVNFPSLHVHPEFYNAIKEQLEDGDESFNSEVNKITEEKAADAVKDELERLKKYKGLRNE